MDTSGKQLFEIGEKMAIFKKTKKDMRILRNSKGKKTTDKKVWFKQPQNESK
jgi:hypothetical protein